MYVAGVYTLYISLLCLPPAAMMIGSDLYLNLYMTGDRQSERSGNQGQAAEEDVLAFSKETAHACELASRFPMLAISAINEVLFEHQGYQGRPNHGDVR